MVKAGASLVTPHPHIARLREVVVTDEGMGLVSDLDEGLPLAMLMRLWMTRKPPVEARLALRLIADLCSAVAHLHEKTSYRPGALSPASVIVQLDGVVKIADAAVLDPVFARDALSQHLDHLPYRAPEQLASDTSPGARADVFTLGVMLYELCAAERLFVAIDPEATRERVRTHSPDLGASGLVQGTRDILQQALAKKPSERFGGAKAMLAAIESLEETASREELAELVQTLIGAHPTMRRLRVALASGGDPADGKSVIRARIEPSEGRSPSSPKQPPRPPPRPTAKSQDGSAKRGRSLPVPTEAPTRVASPARLLAQLEERLAEPPGDEQPAEPENADAGASAPPKVADEQPALPKLGQDPSHDEPEGDEAPTRVNSYAGVIAEIVSERESERESEASAVEAAVAQEGHRSTKSGPVADSMPPPRRRADDVTGKRLGRCILGTEIARGGMATVHLGRWHGAGGFAKTVAVKRLHPQYATDPEFVNMLLDEARVVSRIRHPNVTSTIDVLDSDGELFIVMDYVHGVTLAHLLRQMKRSNQHVPVRVAARIVNGMLHGLHAAHEATDEAGERLEIIHRDVSPENVIIGVDGYSHLIDFGIARALGRHSHSTEGQVKGKLRYLSPEQVSGEDLHGQSDVFSASIVLWESLVRKRLFRGENAGAIAYEIMHRQPTPPSMLRPDVAPAIDRIVLRGLKIDRAERWGTAADMAEALEEVGGMASFREVGEWVQKVGAQQLARLSDVLKEVESMPAEVAENELDMPLAVKSQKGVPGPRAAEHSSESSFDDIPSGVDITSRAAPKRRGVLVGGAIAALLGLFGLVAMRGAGESSRPSPGTDSVSKPAPEPVAPTSTAVEPPPAPSAPPSAEPSAPQAAPDPAPTPSTATSSSSAAPTPRPPTTWPRPGPKPNPNPRLPDGI